MKKIAIIGGKKAYLSERYAYKDFFEKKGFVCNLYLDHKTIKVNKYDYILIIIGVDIYQRGNAFVIHDFQTIPLDRLSVVRNIKVRFKKHFMKKPHLRVFKNIAIKEYFSFKDNIPFVYRDMGIPKSFFLESKNVSEFDFVYTGSMGKERKIKNLLKKFTLNFPDKSLLLIGELPEYLREIVICSKNIISIGRVNYYDIPIWLSKCEFGLHYVPNIFPFNVQLSTKLLEYAAAKLKIVSNKINYLNTFTSSYGGKLYEFENDFSNFNWESISSFQFINPDVSSFEWGQVLDSSGILDKLK